MTPTLQSSCYDQLLPPCLCICNGLVRSGGVCTAMILCLRLLLHAHPPVPAAPIGKEYCAGGTCMGRTLWISKRKKVGTHCARSTRVFWELFPLFLCAPSLIKTPPPSPAPAPCAPSNSPPIKCGPLPMAVRKLPLTSAIVCSMLGWAVEYGARTQKQPRVSETIEMEGMAQESIGGLHITNGKMQLVRHRSCLPPVGFRGAAPSL